VTSIANKPTGASADALAALDARRSVPAKQLGLPGPDDAALTRMLQSAVRVPDHGRRVPFRFVRIAGDARHALGEALARRGLERDPDAGGAAVEKDRNRFTHAPLVIAVVAAFDDGDARIPEQERLLSAGCVCFALLQAAQAMGFGANWLTGWPAYDPVVHRWFGLQAHERIVGFVHIGTPKMEAPERERPDVRALLSDLPPLL
jgi:nitroreductase